jgi:hypothetical protein
MKRPSRVLRGAGEAVSHLVAIDRALIAIKSSNAKDGPLQELHVARAVAKDHGLHDFVIPL